MPDDRDPSLNVLGGPLAVCSARPLTGFYRNGCCDTGRGCVKTPRCGTLSTIWGFIYVGFH